MRPPIGTDREGAIAYLHCSERKFEDLRDAAPEMYEALKAIVEWDESPDGPFAWEILANARAAIAKAEGRV